MLDSAISTAFEFGRDIVRRIAGEKLNDNERLAAEVTVNNLLAARDSALLRNQRDIIIAEVTNGSWFVRNARPGIIWSGLLFILLTSIVIPVAHWATTAVNAAPLPPLVLTLPDQFWWAWTTVVGIYGAGRTYEKVNRPTRLSALTTGSSILSSGYADPYSASIPPYAHVGGPVVNPSSTSATPAPPTSATPTPSTPATPTPSTPATPTPVAP